MANKNVSIHNVPGLVVQLGAWSGHEFNHFAIDTLMRLGMVLDLLRSTDPLWGTAKIVTAFDPDFCARHDDFLREVDDGQLDMSAGLAPMVTMSWCKKTRR